MRQARDLENRNQQITLKKNSRWEVEAVCNSETILRLRPGQWFNDELVNAVTCLVEAAADCRTFVLPNFFYDYLKDGQFALADRYLSKDRTRCAIPICEGKHWVLVLMDLEAKSIRYYDPWEEENPNPARHTHTLQNFMNYINYLYKDTEESQSWEPDILRGPKQARDDCSSCGPLVCQVLKDLKQGRVVTVEITPLQPRRELLGLLQAAPRHQLDPINYETRADSDFEEITHKETADIGMDDGDKTTPPVNVPTDAREGETEPVLGDSATPKRQAAPAFQTPAMDSTGSPWMGDPAFFANEFHVTEHPTGSDAVLSPDTSYDRMNGFVMGSPIIRQDSNAAGIKSGSCLSPSFEETTGEKRKDHHDIQLKDVGTAGKDDKTASPVNVPTDVKGGEIVGDNAIPKGQAASTTPSFQTLAMDSPSSSKSPLARKHELPPSVNPRTSASPATNLGTTPVGGSFGTTNFDNAWRSPEVRTRPDAVLSPGFYDADIGERDLPVESSQSHDNSKTGPVSQTETVDVVTDATRDELASPQLAEMGLFKVQTNTHVTAPNTAPTFGLGSFDDQPTQLESPGASEDAKGTTELDL